MSQYFVRTSNGTVHGPFTANGLRDLAIRGKIVSTTEIRKHGHGTWHPASTVAGLAELVMVTEIRSGQRAHGARDAATPPKPPAPPQASLAAVRPAHAPPPPPPPRATLGSNLPPVPRATPVTTRAPSPEPRLITVDARRSGTRCPYSLEPLNAGTLAAECARCSQLHTVDGWAENGGCTTYGCANAPDFRKDVH